MVLPSTATLVIVPCTLGTTSVTKLMTLTSSDPGVITFTVNTMAAVSNKPPITDPT